MLYYIHGYMSDPNSTKGTLFKEKLNAKAIKYRDCKPEDLIIADCLERIKKEIENDADTVLIGSSLGGLLAAKIAFKNPNVKQIILLNPAIIPPSVDITKIQGMPQRILTDMQDVRLFENKIDSDDVEAFECNGVIELSFLDLEEKPMRILRIHKMRYTSFDPRVPHELIINGKGLRLGSTKIL